jgi:hypothetical protein
MKIRIADEQADELRTLSRNAKITMTSLVRVAIHQYLNKFAPLIHSPLIRVGKGRGRGLARLGKKKS